MATRSPISPGTAQGQAASGSRTAAADTEGRRPGTSVTATASAAPEAAKTRLPLTPNGPSISAPPTAAPIADAPKAIVDSQVNASVVACAGAIEPTSELCTVSVGAIAVPPRNSSAPSAHGLDTMANGARPMVTPSRPQRYCRGSETLTTRAPNHRPPATEPSDHTASSTPLRPGDPEASANAGMATSSPPKPSISAEPLSSTRGMPGASTVVSSPVRGPDTGTQARMTPDVAMPRAPATASTPATATAVASRAKAVGRTAGSTRDHSARTVPDTSGVVAPAAAEAAMTAAVGASTITAAT